MKASNRNSNRTQGEFPLGTHFIAKYPNKRKFIGPDKIKSALGETILS